MADENVQQGPSYGYASDEVKVNPFNFGLNTPVYLKKFEWIPNGGKDGAEQEALDIIFDINGTDKSYRLFPITKVYGKNNEEITDRNAPEFKDAFTDMNARITHILHAFHPDGDVIKAGLSVPITSFKQFAQLAASLLPKDFNTIPLDIFLQFQWQTRGEQDKTYLEIPSKMKYGRWLAPATPGASWKEVRVDNPQESTREALYYVNENGPKDEAGNYTQKHLFTKNGWFMLSNFAKQQRAGGESSNASSPATASNVAASNIQAEGAAKAASW